MLDKMKQLMELKRQAEALKRELDAAYMVVSEVPGIKIVINGSQNFISLDIDDALLTMENKNRIKSDLLRSLNDAIKKSQSLAAQKMKAITGMNLPGL